MSRCAIEERRLATEDAEWLHRTGAEIYGTAETFAKELLEHKEEWRRFSTHGGLVGKANILAWVAMLEQESMQTAYNVMRYGDGDEAKGIGKALYRRFERLEEMRSVLDDRDLRFLAAVKERWSGRFDKISRAIYKLTGAPLQSAGADYFPIVRQGDIELSRVSGMKSRIPGYVVPRTVNFKDIDDDADILTIFNDRAREDARLLSYGDFGFEMDAVVKTPELQDAMRRYMTDTERNEFVRFVDQSVNGADVFVKTAEGRLFCAITNVTAFYGLGWNPVSAAKQLTGALNPGLEQAMRDFGSGAYGDGASGLRKFIAKTRPFAMTAGMDSVASALGGAALYTRFLNRHMQTHDEAEAKRLAMLDFMEIVERTQQSSLTHNQSSMLRNYGFIGRAVMQFKSNPQLFFSYEVKAVKDWWNDKGNAEKFKRLCSVVAVNHFVIPAAFNGMGIMLSLLMGDDWDEDDLELFAMNAATDVLSGWWLGGAIKGLGAIAVGMNNWDIASELVPAAGLTRVGNQVGLILRDFAEGELGENYEKRLVNLFKSAFPPGRYAMKIYENATDDERGVVW